MRALRGPGEKVLLRTPTISSAYLSGRGGRASRNERSFPARPAVSRRASLDRARVLHHARSAPAQGSRGPRGPAERPRVKRITRSIGANGVPAALSRRRSGRNAFVFPRHHGRLVPLVPRDGRNVLLRLCRHPDSEQRVSSRSGWMPTAVRRRATATSPGGWPTTAILSPRGTSGRANLPPAWPVRQMLGKFAISTGRTTVELDRKIADAVRGVQATWKSDRSIRQRRAVAGIGSTDGRVLKESEDKEHGGFGGEPRSTARRVSLLLRLSTARKGIRRSATWRSTRRRG